MSAGGPGPEHGAGRRDDTPVKPSFLGTLRAVGWAFFGVRSEQRKFEQDLRQMNPVHVIMIGLLLAAAFVAVLLTIAHLAATG